MDLEYEAYVAAEWDKFEREPQRLEAALRATEDERVKCVLDVGCGAGQELLPFVSRGAFGVGTDMARDAGVLGQRFFNREGHDGKVAFLRSAAEQLPFRSCAFDVLISRLALPYTDNRQALSEMARVLRSGGTLLLKIHHGWYYVDKFWRGLIGVRILSSVHAARVLASGALYHLTGGQVRNRLVTGETFQSRWLLKRELARNGLMIVGEMPDSNAKTPSFVIRKTDDD